MSQYKQLKNHIHNTLEITKKDIRNMVSEAVENIVERKLEILFRDKYDSQWTMQRIIDDTIRDKSQNWWWGESETNLDDYIKSRVVTELLKNVKLKVELVKTQKEQTKPYNNVRRIVRKK